jgi:hypothetical protein
MKPITALKQRFSKLPIAVIGIAMPRRAKQCFARV